MKSHDITIGSVFGRWTVIGPPTRKKLGTGRGANYPLMYPCRCECGVERDVRAFKLLSNSRSCGCLKRELRAADKLVHGQNRPGRRTKLYSCWTGIVQRCTNPNHDSYDRYGGRGITICSEWRDFTGFAPWAIANGFAPGLEIDRIDNDGNYEPGNCRWVTGAINKRNTSANVLIEAFGELKCATDWALDERCTVTPSTIQHRMRKLGWAAEEAIAHPRRSRKTAKPFAGNHPVA